MSSALASIASAVVSTVVSAVTDTSTVTLSDPASYSMMRHFPANTAKGVLRPPVTNQVVINGVLFNVAAGVQIRNMQNLIVMPAGVQTAMPVRYQLDGMGNVWRIWILSSAELAAN